MRVLMIGDLPSLRPRSAPCRGHVVAGGGPFQFNSILVDIEETSGRAMSIARADREVA